MPPTINDLDACQRVATMRRGGIPDSMIASELGISLERLRVVCPDDGSDPLGLYRDRSRNGVAPPHRPRGHVGDPFAGIPRAEPSEPQPEGAGGIGLLIVLWLLAR